MWVLPILFILAHLKIPEVELFLGFFWSTFSFLLNHRTDTNVCHQSLARNGILYETYLLGHGGGRYSFVEYVSLIEDIDSCVRIKWFKCCNHDLLIVDSVKNSIKTSGHQLWIGILENYCYNYVDTYFVVKTKVSTNEIALV